jgi:hypothetical protein
VVLQFRQSYSAVLLCLAVLAPSQSAAQVATNDLRQPSGGRGAQTLSLSLDMQAGRDDNVIPQGDAGSIALSAGIPGYVGSGNAAIAYTAGRPDASVELNGQTFAFSDSVNRHPVAGGNIDVKGHFTLGGRTQFDVSQVVRSEPYLMLGAFSGLPVADDIFSPDLNPQNGLAANRSLASSTSAAVRRNWSRRSSTRFEYRLDRRMYDLTPELDNLSHAASLSYEHSLSRSVSLEANYNYWNIDALMAGAPLDAAVSQTAEAGFRYSRALSRNRNVTLRAGGGAMLHETTDESTTLSATSRAPSAYASLSLGLREGWQLGVDYRRSVTGLNGLLADTYIADATTMQISGLLPADLLATVSGAYSASTDPQNGSGSRASGFVTYVLAADLRFLATRQWSAHVTYTKMHDTFDRTQIDVSATVPASTYDVSRNSVRLRLTMLVPVIGPRTSRVN